ncbi:MAG TPA: AMIN domain-containing protein [Candidatus Sulfotelmatobacter sp.]|nr:AMIN domain-containing protein [Candidatus Sulfotelmatobacter sp.]
MKLTTGIVAMAMMAGGLWAQNPDAIDTARSVAKSLQQQQATDTKTAKPAPGAPAPAVKPVAIPGQKPAASPVAAAPKPAAKAPAKAAPASAHNQLQHVNVVPGTNDIQIEISTTGSVTPNITKLSTPERVLVELPETSLATSQNKIPVGSGGVKRVRIGMDGNTPPNTSVVVDLEKALSYDVVPGPAGKVVLILHTQDAGTAVAKSGPAPAAKIPAAKAASSAQPQVAAKTPAAGAKPVIAPAATATKAAAGKPVAAPAVAVAKPAVGPAPKADTKQQAKTVVAAKASPVTVAGPPTAKPAEAPKPKEEKKWAMSGKRDPFFSPVVQEHGSGCSTGKKCLEIGTINLRGVVKSDSGFIAVVTNNLNKAYFLRENDPVFNGFVVKITGDSVTFQETIQDKLGKSFTREVVKRIFTPAV